MDVRMNGGSSHACFVSEPCASKVFLSQFMTLVLPVAPFQITASVMSGEPFLSHSCNGLTGIAEGSIL